MALTTAQIEAALTPEYVTGIMGDIAETSAFGPNGTLGNRITVVGSKANLKFWAAVATAGWVTGELGTATLRKPQTTIGFKSKSIIPATIAAILPFKEEWIDDSNSGVDLLASGQKALAEAIARAIDQAIIWGGSFLPAEWVTAGFAGLVPEAITAANVAYVSSHASETGGVRPFLAACSDALGLVEADGNNPAGWLGPVTLKSLIRSGYSATLSDAAYLGAFSGPSADPALWGLPLTIESGRAWVSDNGTADGTTPTTAGALALTGDWSKVIIGVRDQLKVKVLDQATITNGSGVIHLAEEDAVALRVNARIGITVDDSANGTADQPYPVAVVRNGAPASTQEVAA